MNNISSLLTKFKNILLSEEVRREMVAQVIFQVLNIKLDPKDIKITNEEAHIKATPALKGEIFMRKKEILEAFSSFPETKQLRDIR